MNHATTNLTLTALQSSSWVSSILCPSSSGVIGPAPPRHGTFLPRTDLALRARIVGPSCNGEGPIPPGRAELGQSAFE